MAVDDGGPVAADGHGTAAEGTLVIRTWFEPGAGPGQQPGFRARITSGRSGGGQRETVATADPDEVLRVVQEWLADQRADGDAGRSN